MRQGALTIVAPVVPLLVEELRRRLDVPGGALRRGEDAPHPLRDVPGVHFARWLVLPATGDYPPQLAFESNYDGDEGNHIADLAALRDRLDAFYECCEGYPELGARTAETRRDYLVGHTLPYGAWHNGHPGLAVEVVRNDAALVKLIQRFVDTIDPARLSAMTPFELRDEIREHVRERKAQDPSLIVERVDRELPNLWSFVVLVALLVLAFLGLCGWLVYVRSTATLAALGAIVGAAVFVVGYVLVQEDREARSEKRWFPIYERAHDDHMTTVVAEEDNQPQNPFSHVVDLKAGRAPVIDFVMWLIELLARNFYFRGALGTIASIHFGRWVRIDGGRRLLFFSNYDGSWESYLGDFIDRSSPWLTAVWSNTAGFPNTTLLFFYGAKDEDGFKRWVRVGQLPTQYWYAAYPGLSVFNVQNNAAIRDGIFEEMSEKATRRWLERL